MHPKEVILSVVAIWALLWLATAKAPADDASTGWALRPLVKPALPATVVTTRVGVDVGARTPVDAFIREKLDQAGLSPSAPADRRTLLRRATFDLTGLPPSPDDLKRFQGDPSPNAFDRELDRLLASPRYGERWARHWMDVVHYAETHGHDEDAIRPNMWPYRDYLIAAFNSDKPYARFVREQVAGDVLYPAIPEATVATAFLATGPWDASSQMGIQDGTIDKERARYLDRDDMIATTMSTFVSATVHCARCHDHKMDPIPTEDYYALQAVFAGVDRVDRPYDPNPEVAARRRSLTKDLAELESGHLPRTPASTRTWKEDVENWEKSRRRHRWHALPLVSHRSENGATLERQADGSVLSSGHRPEKDTYFLTFSGPAEGITAIQLEVMIDPSLPESGPGRADNGNLHLSEIVIRPREQTGGIADSRADFNQEGWTISMAHDGVETTAWGIFPQVSAPHRAMFVLKQPITLSEEETLTIELRQWHGGGHLIGRPRISFSQNPEPSLASPLPPDVEAALKVPSSERDDAQWKTLALHRALEDTERELASLPAPRFVYAVASEFSAQGNFKPAVTPREVRVLHRGDILSPGPLATPGSLSCVSRLANRFPSTNGKDEGERRAALAQWLADPENVLTWRSIANRVWHYHFGVGIVATPNDFGQMGSPPSHPALLDWLACELRDNGGSLKQLHRLMMKSAVYRQRSEDNRAGRERDQTNRWLWRAKHTRLEAECYRDAVLALSGDLDLEMGGPSARHFNLTKGVHVTPNLDYFGFDPEDPVNFRRSVYRFVFRTVPDPLMQSLDCPDASQFAPKRAESTTALQALATLNSPFLISQSTRIAARLERERPNLKAQIALLFDRALQRPPDEEETAAFVDLASRHGLANACRVMINSSEFLYLR